MRRLFCTVALVLALSQVSFVDAAPRRCRVKTAWPGYEMGGNPWGAVVAPTKSSAQGVTGLNSCSTSSAEPAVSSSDAITTSLSSVFAPGTTSDLATVSTSSVSSSSEEITTSSSFSTSTTIEQPSTSVAEQPTTTIIEEQPTSSDPPVETSTPDPTTSSEPPPPPPSPSSSPEPSPEPSSSEPPPPASTANSFTTDQDNGNSNDSGSNGSNASGADVDEYLSTHNSVRAQHGASPLSWNNTLATAAQRWSDGCLFQHSGGALGPFGENLAAGTGGSYGITSAVTSWTDEVSEYNPNNPSASHFTQVVWKGTTQLGCAETTCAGGTIFSDSSKYYVCEYFPQGNVIGAFAQNVQA